MYRPDYKTASMEALGYLIVLIFALPLLWTVVNAQPLKPQPQEPPTQEEQTTTPSIRAEYLQSSMIKITGENGNTFVWIMPSVVELSKEYTFSPREGVTPPTQEQIYQFFYVARAKCSMKAIMAATVMMGKLDDQPMEGFIKVVKDMAKKYDMERYIRNDYERVVRQGYRTYSTPEKFVEEEFFSCINKGY